MAGNHDDRRGGCFKFGCLGCGGAAVFIFFVSSMTMFALFSDGRGTSNEHPRIDYVLPGDFELVEYSGEFMEIEDGIFSGPEDDLAIETMGRVVLDVSGGSLEIVPGEPGEEIRVEGDYDPERFELKAGFEKSDDGTWVYGLSFKGGGAISRSGGNRDRVKLILPPDAPFQLSGEVGIGESRIELGGLSVTAVDLELGTGSHEISFSEPLPMSMDHFRVEGATGETKVEQLGNASPASVYVSHDIGELVVDLSGEWNRDADEVIEIDVKSGIGECVVRVPETARIEYEKRGWLLGDFNTRDIRDLPQNENVELPTLKIGATLRIGELRFRD